jgi:hypothetical protein
MCQEPTENTPQRNNPGIWRRRYPIGAVPLQQAVLARRITGGNAVQ